MIYLHQLLEKKKKRIRFITLIFKQNSFLLFDQFDFD